MASRRYCGTSIMPSGEFRSFTLPKWRATADEDGHYAFAVAL
jgi:hypothetical protein